VGFAGRARRTGLGVLLAAVACAAGLAPSAHAALPPGFVSETVATIPLPTDVAFLPGGRVLVSQQSGTLRALDDGVLEPDPVLTVPDACTNSERGMLGIQPAEDFATSGHVFVYYTHQADDGTCGSRVTPYPYNRVSRFTMGPDGTIDPSTEQVLVDRIPSFRGNHNAGDLAIGRDGLLYVSIGDSGCDPEGGLCGIHNQAAQHLNILNGKILRIATDGSVPPSNPFTGPDSARCNTTGLVASGTVCQEIYAYGLRNPFRMAFDPNDPGTRFFINDVGAGTWEEIDEGGAGLNYGWPAREGHCAVSSTTDCTPVPGFTEPLYAYQHAAGCKSITGGAFVPAGLWPAAYEGTYLFSDFGCGKIFLRSADGTVTTFADALGTSTGSAVTLDFGPSADGTVLYYTTYANGGELRRIRYTGSENRAPVARATATPASGTVPMRVTVDASASTDADGDALTYRFHWGDGTNDTTSTSPAVSHAYRTVGTFDGTVTVSDGSASSVASFAVEGENSPPAPVIDAPAAKAKFRVGEVVALRGHQNDKQDGPSTDRLSWEVVLHDDTGDHTIATATGAEASFTGPAPASLAAAEVGYVEVRLTATDTHGASRTAVRRMKPLGQSLGTVLRTSPGKLTVEAAGESVRTTFVVPAWTGWEMPVSAPAEQNDASGRRWVFDHWSDGGARTHTYLVPDTRTTLTATYVRG